MHTCPAGVRAACAHTPRGVAVRPTRGVCVRCGTPAHFCGVFACPGRRAGAGETARSTDFLSTPVCSCVISGILSQLCVGTDACVCVLQIRASGHLLPSVYTCLCVLGVSLHSCVCPVSANETQQVLARAGTRGVCILRVPPQLPACPARPRVSGRRPGGPASRVCARAGSRAGARRSECE